MTLLLNDRPLLYHRIQLLYNDLSPMENHHVAASFAILRRDGNNFLGHLQRRVGSHYSARVNGVANAHAAAHSHYNEIPLSAPKFMGSLTESYPCRFEMFCGTSLSPLCSERT